MAGASDISVILSQTGRIEKINQSPFAQSEVTKQILTEQEARERLRLSKEVSETKKNHEIATRERIKDKEQQGKKRESKGKDDNSQEQEQEQEKEEKHIIDVVI